MKILTNKFFIFGNLLLLLIAIPVTLFFVKKQQEVRSKAAASSRLYFNPSNPSSSTQCTQGFNVDLMVDPGTNLVSIVNFYITYDATKLDVSQITPAGNFTSVVRPASVTPGQANMSLSVGGDVTKAVSTPSKVATITFVPKAAGSVQILFDSSKSSIYSLQLHPTTGPTDAPTENVLSSGDPATVTIGTDTCTGGATITPTGGAGVTPGVSGSPTATPGAGGSGDNGNGDNGGSITSTNQAPTCTTLAAAPTTGNAPLSVLFTGSGNDPDTNGLVAKASFNFGDGQNQDVTTGLNQKSVTAQINHTYQSAGVFSASLVFTDDQGAQSVTCSQNVTVSAASGSATLTPTATIAPTAIPTIAPSATPTLVQKPTVPPTGDVGQTIGILVTVITTIGAGLALLAL
ncbi:MAG TPA: PKD domain-containing protein [Patescibacteria group bacterium]|nr:PKD domain-containing protein [Patescibacteria group bacterium]